MAKAADLSRFQVNAEQGSAPMEAPPASKRRERSKATVPLITKGFRLKPEAARQFDLLKVEVEGVSGKDKGPALIAEALNLLFVKYGKPRVAWIITYLIF
jgi:hypothetical protein